MQRLILLLLHNPQLREQMESIEGLAELDDPDAATLQDLCTLLDQNPHYTINHILGYWRGIYGADRGEELARVVAADMMDSRAHTPRDDLAEFQDICHHLRHRLESNLSPAQQLEGLLARTTFTSEDRKRITLLQAMLSKEEKELMYQQIKTALQKSMQ